MDVSQNMKSTQEQAVASWIDHLNQLRINELVDKLTRQDINLQGALHELNVLKNSVGDLIDSNRGGGKGLHGFIAERAQVYIENARSLVKGLKQEYILIDDNGPVDYLRNGEPIQQKFVQSKLGLDAIKEHLEKYPHFVKNGGTYQIPKDYYEKLKRLMELNPEIAKKLKGEDYKLWMEFQRFLKETGLSPDDIQPSVVDYRDVQRGTIDKTIKDERDNVESVDQELRDKAHQESKPSLKEGAKATAIAAAAEGGMTFCLGVAKKLKSGKKLAEFTAQDWKEVGLDTTVGAAKGAIRGASVYGLTNFTATPAAVASALVTATFGVAAQARLLRQGKITTEDFIANSEVVCLDVTVSAIASLMGQVAIPVPVLGAIIGNAVGMFMYGIAKEYLVEEEQRLIASYNDSIQKLNEQLDVHYQKLIEMLKREFAKFKSIVELAFDLNVNTAFYGSVTLAQYVDCPDEMILKDKGEVDAFFLD